MDINSYSVTDLYTVFDFNTPEQLQMRLKKIMQEELEICSASSSTEEDKQAYQTLMHCIDAKVLFEDASIKTNGQIDRNKLSETFLKKYSSLIDLVEMNFQKKNQFFLENEIQNMLEANDMQNRLMEYIQPQIIEELSSLLGGIS